jgi:hypothetical protein
MGVNFTCVSYRDTMDFGIIVDPDLLPHHDTIAIGLEQALAEYIALCKPTQKGRKKPAVKAKRKTTPKTARRKSATTKAKSSPKNSGKTADKPKPRGKRK